MPRFSIVVADADRAHAALVQSYRLHPVQQIVVAAQAKRPVGLVHAVAETDCPDGGTNCRNCGDPAFADSCRAEGHCKHCGTRHGIAPDSTLATNGYVLRVV